MTNFLDRSSEREAEILHDALEEQARRDALRGKTFSDSAVICRVCDEKIPIERRKALPGVQTCFECQQWLEAQLKTRKGTA